MKRSRPKTVTIYLGVMVALGAVAIGSALYRLVEAPAAWQWLILAALTILTGSFTVKLPGVNAKISAGDTLILTNLVLFGPAAGTLTAALDGLAGSLRCKTRSRRLEFALFNTAAMALSASIGGIAFTSVLGTRVLNGVPAALISQLLPAMALLALVHFACNSLFVSLMIGFEQRMNFLAVWRDRFLWAAVHYVAAASTAGLFASTDASINALVVLTILAVVAAIYINCRDHADAFDE